jgi:hypothetical protein
VTPWTSFWDRNYFVAQAPWLRELLLSSLLRVAVSVVGLYTAIGGMREFSAAMAWRARARPAKSEQRPEP